MLVRPDFNMNYKDYSQYYLQSSINDIIYDESEEIGQFDAKQLNEIFNNLLSNLQNQKLDGIKECAMFLKSYTSEDYLKKFIKSDIPYLLCSSIVFYVHNNMDIAKNTLISLKVKRKIANDKILIYSLFLVNEFFKLDELINYQFFTPEIIEAFFVIYEFCGSYSANYAISILTLYARHSIENLNNLLSLDYKSRVMEMCQHPLSSDLRIHSFYALFPFLQVNDVKHNRDIIELFVYLQGKTKDFKTLLAVIQFFNIYIRLSDKCMEIAVEHEAVELAKTGLTTTTIENDGSILTLRKTSTDMLLYLLDSGYIEYFTKIMKFDIFKIIGTLLSSYDHNYDILAGCRILDCILRKNNENSEDDILEIIQIILRYDIVSKLCNSIRVYTFDIKSVIIKIFSTFFRSGNQSLIEQIVKSCVFVDIIDSIEDLDDEEKIFIIGSLCHVVQKYPDCMNYFDIEDAENLFSQMNRITLNPEVLDLSQLMINLLAQSQ